MFQNIKKIAIIEPHYDDAWINLGGFILKNPQIDFLILSITEIKTNNKNETKQLEKILPNVKTKALKYRGLQLEIKEKLRKKEWKKEFCKINKLSDYKEFENKIKKEVQGYELIILPLGVWHPQHTLLSEITLPNKTMYYREFPYCFYKKIKNLRRFFEIFRRGKEIFFRSIGRKKVRINISDRLAEKIRIFKQVYQSQRLILDEKRINGKSLNNIKKEILFH